MDNSTVQLGYMGYMSIDRKQLIARKLMENF